MIAVAVVFLVVGAATLWHPLGAIVAGIIFVLYTLR